MSAALVSKELLDAEAWPACVLDREGIIVDVNQAWDRVAHESCGPDAASVLGTWWLGHIAGSALRAWYAAVLARVLTAGAVGETYRCDCNTPLRYRLFTSRFEPVRSGTDQAAGVLIRTTMLVDSPIADRYPIAPPDEHRYHDAHGLIMQCSGCRRVRVAGSSPQVWEFVPEYVGSPRPDVSHGLCRRCRDLYYGDPIRV